MWDIYMENPNTYKMKTIEIKKIQQIDRKLRNYSKTSSYKSYNGDQIDVHRNRTLLANRTENPLMLLKDLDKLDPYITIENHNNKLAPADMTVNRSAWWQTQWESNKGNAALNDEASVKALPKPAITNTNRFKIEKLKEIV